MRSMTGYLRFSYSGISPSITSMMPSAEPRCQLLRTPFPRTPEMPHVPGPIGPGPPAKGCPYRGEIMAYCACTSGSPDPGQILRRQVGIGPEQRAKAGGARKVRFQESLATDAWNGAIAAYAPH